MKTLATVRIAAHGDYSVASLSGEVDLTNAAGIETQLLDSIPNTARALIIDLSKTTYLDSRGVQLLLGVVDRLHTRRQRVYLVVPEESVLRQLLGILSVTSALGVEGTVDAAAERIRSDFPP